MEWGILGEAQVRLSIKIWPCFCDNFQMKRGTARLRMLYGSHALVNIIVEVDQHHNRPLSVIVELSYGYFALD